MEWGMTVAAEGGEGVVVGVALVLELWRFRVAYGRRVVAAIARRHESAAGAEEPREMRHCRAARRGIGGSVGHGGECKWEWVMVVVVVVVLQANNEVSTHEQHLTSSFAASRRSSTF